MCGRIPGEQVPGVGWPGEHLARTRSPRRCLCCSRSLRTAGRQGPPGKAGTRGVPLRYLAPASTKEFIKAHHKMPKRSVSFFSLVAPLWLVRPHVGGTEAGGCQLWGPSQISPAWGQRSHVGTDPRAGISLSIASWGLAVPSHCPWGSPCHPSHHGMTTSSTSQGWCREQPRTALTVSPQQALPSRCPITLGPSTALPSDTVGA